MYSRIRVIASLLLVASGVFGTATAEVAESPKTVPEKIIIDTDIGTDIDDAFAVALALASPELDIRGIASATGDIEARARILDRMLGEAGRKDIPIAAGVVSTADPGMSQIHYGEAGHFARRTHPNAVDFILDQIRRFPGEITLVTIGPLSNIGAVIDKSPETFRKLKRVVMMGGWIEPVKPDYGDAAAQPVIPEYNIMADVGASQKLFRSGVSLYVMPQDATHRLRLDEFQRRLLFAHGSPLTDSLTLLYQEWIAADGITAVLHDSLPVAFIVNPSLCKTTPMHVRIDDAGVTRVEPGASNAQVCLQADSDAFFRMHMDRLLKP